MAWPIYCETEQIKKLLETPFIQSMFRITKIEMGKANSQIIKVEGLDESGKKIEATFAVMATGPAGTGCPEYSFLMKKSES